MFLHNTKTVVFWEQKTKVPPPPFGGYQIAHKLDQKLLKSKIEL